VNVYLSGLTALFRVVFAIVAIVSLLNLTNKFRMITTPDYLTLFKTDQLAAQVMLSVNAFRTGFHFGLLFFGIYLGLLGTCYGDQHLFHRFWACCWPFLA